MFLYAVTMLIFLIERIISSEKWFNYVAPFFFENAKNLGQSDDAKRRKKEDGLKDEKILFLANLLKKNFSIEGCY